MGEIIYRSGKRFLEADPSKMNWLQEITYPKFMGCIQNMRHIPLTGRLTWILHVLTV